MTKITVGDEDVARLDGERQRADRDYNDALTEVDRAAARPRLAPTPPPGPDEARLPELNSSWEVIGPRPVAATGWRGRVAGAVWRIVAPLFQRQQSFNAALVDHLNRAHGAAVRNRDAVAALADGIREESAAMERFEARLIGYLQQVTGYVDTKDRYEAGVLRQLIEHRTTGLAAGLDAVGDELLKRWERLSARQQRLEARIEELRRGGAAPAAPLQPGVADVAADAAAPGPVEPHREGTALAGEDFSPTYVGFEDRFRGSEETIGERLAEYLPLFAGAREVVDLGCGRGEFLEALRAQGIHGRGVDLNSEMVRRCRDRGLDVVQGDALEFLAALPDASLDGIFAAQVIEHLPPDRLLRLLALAHAKVRPGGRLVLETINPACWYAFFSSYILDLTHVRPVHPETLRYLMAAAGFDPVDIRFSSPYPREHKLRPARLSLLGHAPDLEDLLEAFNENVEKLNSLIFSYLDYAGVGTRRPDGEGG